MNKYLSYGNHNSGSEAHEFVVEMLTYYEPEEKLFYAICLSLDIVAAADTEKDAVKAYNDMLDDFAKYTCNKGTIANELIRMGWNVHLKGKKSFKAIAPTIEELKNNPDWADIWAKNPQIGSGKLELAL